jgi:hypothetical protein
MKKWIKYFATVLIAFFIFSGICKAEPDSTIKYLMNEPISMLEWGLFRLEQNLKRTSREYKANYYQDINRIYIEYMFDNKLQDLHRAKDACKNVFIEIRSAVASPLIFNHSFSHSMHYKFKNEPTDLAEKLMAITEIYVVA